jgi:hypothetical protein
MTGGGQRYRERVETKEYQAQYDDLAQKYTAEMLENALRGVFWGITTRAEEFPRYTGLIYRAQTESRSSEVPRFRIFFSIESDHRVLMLWIETVGNGVMEKLT